MVSLARGDDVTYLIYRQVEELKSTRDTLEQDLEEQVAEYQDMMKCCANLQQENQVHFTLIWLIYHKFP